MPEHRACISVDKRPMNDMLETRFFFWAKDCTELRRLLCAILLLFVSTGMGCRVVLPSCSPSQLWPVYAAQQEAKAYQEQFGNCSLDGACATPGNPQSDFRMGFRDGYLHEVSQRYNLPPGPCPPRGWGWVGKHHGNTASSSYQQGLISGSAAGSYADFGTITKR